MVEPRTVNALVGGSNPSRGANFCIPHINIVTIWGIQMPEKLTVQIIWAVVITLGLIVSSTVLVLLIALFDPVVDNTEIFKMLQPAFNTIVGAFVGLLGGLTISKNKQ